MGADRAGTAPPTMQDVVGWDVRTWSRAVDCWALALDGPDFAGRTLDVLEVGAGPGGPSLWLGTRGHRVVTSNLDHTETQARPLHERYGVEAQYVDLDLTAGLPYRERFDVVVFKSVLGGLGSADPELPRAALRAMHDALRPGGILLWAENLRGAWFHRAARRIAYRVRKARWWQFVSLRRLGALLDDAFVDVDLHVGGVFAVLGTTEARRDRLARADEAFWNRVVPRASHYMAYGTARRASEGRAVHEPK